MVYLNFQGIEEHRERYMYLRKFDRLNCKLLGGKGGGGWGPPPQTINHGSYIVITGNRQSTQCYKAPPISYSSLEHPDPKLQKQPIKTLKTSAYLSTLIILLLRNVN